LAQGLWYACELSHVPVEALCTHGCATSLPNMSFRARPNLPNGVIPKSTANDAQEKPWCPPVSPTGWSPKRRPTGYKMEALSSAEVKKRRDEDLREEKLERDEKKKKKQEQTNQDQERTIEAELDKNEDDFQEKMSNRDFLGAMEVFKQPWSFAASLLLAQSRVVDMAQKRQQAERQMRSCMGRRGSFAGALSPEPSGSASDAPSRRSSGAPLLPPRQSKASTPSFPRHLPKLVDESSEEEVSEGYEDSDEDYVEDDEDLDIVFTKAKIFSKVARSVWISLTADVVANMAMVGMRLTAASVRLKEWNQVDIIAQQVIDVLRGYTIVLRLAHAKNAEERSLIEMSLHEGPPFGEEERWAMLMVRRGVASACKGPEHFTVAEERFTHVLKFLPKEGHAKRALKSIRFLRQQILPSGLPKNHEAGDDLAFWADTHSRGGRPLRSVGEQSASHGAAELPPVFDKAELPPSVKQALESMADVAAQIGDKAVVSTMEVQLKKDGSSEVRLAALKSLKKAFP